MLVYVAQLLLDWLVRGPWRDPRATISPRRGASTRRGAARDPAVLGPRQSGLRLRAGRGRPASGCCVSRTLKGFEVRVLGQARGPGASPASPPRAMVFFAFVLVRRAGRPCRDLGGFRRHRPAAAVDLAGLRLHRHHRRLSRPPQPARHRRRRPGARRSPISAARRRRSRSAFPTRWRGSSRACSSSSCSAAIR